VERSAASVIQRQEYSKENIDPERLRSALEKPRPMPEAKVDVHLYDLSDGFAKINAVSIDLIGFGGGLHTGVEVYGHEWSFGIGGVSCTVPKKNRYYVYRQTVSMGKTAMTPQEVERVIAALQNEWKGSDYDLFTKNCGTFCNTLCIRLGLGGLPAWVTRLAEAGGQSTAVRRIADLMVRNGLIGEGSPSSSCPYGAVSGSDYESPVKNLATIHAEFSGFEDAWLEEQDMALYATGNSVLGEPRLSLDGNSGDMGVLNLGQITARQQSHMLQQASACAPLRALSYDDLVSTDQGKPLQRRMSSVSTSAPLSAPGSVKLTSAPGSVKLVAATAVGGG
jgi:hypothetical protein